MLRKIVILKENKIVYRRDYGETFSWEAISHLIVSLSYFVKEAKDVLIDILNTVFYKIAYSTNKQHNLLFVMVTYIGDSEEVISEQLQSFNVTVSELLEAA